MYDTGPSWSFDAFFLVDQKGGAHGCLGRDFPAGSYVGNEGRQALPSRYPRLQFLEFGLIVLPAFETHSFPHGFFARDSFPNAPLIDRGFGDVVRAQ